MECEALCPDAPVATGEGMDDGAAAMLPEATASGAQARAAEADLAERHAAPASPEVALAPSDTAEPGASAGRSPRNNLFLMGVLAALFCVMGTAVVFSNAYDNDVWFLMATGREIVEHGIPYVNPFSLHEGLGIVVQQWLVCVWLYVLYEAGGFVATALWTLALFGAFAYSAYRLARLLRRGPGGGEWLLVVMLVVAYSMTYYMTVRPHLLSMIAFVWIVFFLEKYRQRGALGGSDATPAPLCRDAAKWLVPIPLIVALHGNVQAAIAPFDLVIVGCYLVPDLLRPLHRRGRLRAIALSEASYARMPLLVLLVACGLALLANPYFVDGALYLVNSYGSAEYAGYIAEMSDFAPAKSFRFALVLLALLAACVCVGRRGARHIDLPLVLLVTGTAYMAFDHVRNIWLCSLFCFMLIVASTRGVALGWPRRLARSELACIVPLIAGVAVACACAFVNVPALQALPKNDSCTPVAALDYLDEREVDKQDVRVFTFFNAGGYIEWRGYKVNMDPRPEIWAPPITGEDFDYYREYVDMAQGTTVFNLYRDKYDFDVFILPSDEAAIDILRNDWTYMQLPGGDDYVAFAKRSLVSHDASEAQQIELPS